MPASRNVARTLAMAAGAAATRRVVNDLYTAGKSRMMRKKTYKRSSERLPGFVRTPPVKKYLQDQSDETRGANQLHFSDCLEFLTQGDSINQRLRQQIYVKSIRISCYFQPVLIPTSAHLFRWALIQPKGRRIPATPNDVGEDLFEGQQTSRYVNFSSIANAMHKQTFRINRESWHVHAEGRANMKPFNSNWNGSQEVFFQMDKTIPVNKMVYYDTIDGKAQNSCLFVFWFNQPFYNAIAADATNTNRGTIQYTTYFIEP